MRRPNAASSPTSPSPDRVAFVADLAANWVRLRRTPAHATARSRSSSPTIPTRTGRIGNGVGYDTPASTIAILKALKAAGYDVGEHSGERQ